MSESKSSSQASLAATAEPLVDALNHTNMVESRSDWVAHGKNLWYRGWHWFCTRVYFRKITVFHPERMPANGPVLYLGLHRNGAVDGFIYHTLVGQARFLISIQLRKNPVSRLFFDGIEVTRQKDEGNKAQNYEALRQCLQVLRDGKSLFIFPEGTSSLGPRHLPFKSGAVNILLHFLAEGRALQVIPLGIHYACPWEFRSKVEIVVGKAICTDLPEGLSPLGEIKEMKRRCERALGEVGINVDTPARQENIQQLAYIATLGTNRSYFAALKQLENGIPAGIQSEWEEIQSELSRHRLLRHQQVPLFPTTLVALYLLRLIVTSPIVLLAMLLNAPPLLAGWWAGQKFSDGPNVISLWKILVGLPLFVIWTTAMLAMITLLGGLGWALLYLGMTFAGLKLYAHSKKLCVAVYNSFRYPNLRGRALAFRNRVLQELPE